MGRASSPLSPAEVTLAMNTILLTFLGTLVCQNLPICIQPVFIALILALTSVLQFKFQVYWIPKYLATGLKAPV